MGKSTQHFALPLPPLVRHIVEQQCGSHAEGHQVGHHNKQAPPRHVRLVPKVLGHEGRHLLERSGGVCTCFYKEECERHGKASRRRAMCCLRQQCARKEQRPPSSGTQPAGPRNKPRPLTVTFWPWKLMMGMSWSHSWLPARPASTQDVGLRGSTGEQGGVFHRGAWVPALMCKRGRLAAAGRQEPSRLAGAEMQDDRAACLPAALLPPAPDPVEPLPAGWNDWVRLQQRKWDGLEYPVSAPAAGWGSQQGAQARTHCKQPTSACMRHACCQRATCMSPCRPTLPIRPHARPFDPDSP